MEACPKIEMLNFDLKTCNFDSTDFGEKISTYIFTHYQENPESFFKEINELLQLRENAISSSKDFMGLNLLKKYFHQLQFLSNRFPMKSGEECETEFSWDHLYNEKEIAHNDVRFEQESILYNIGAMHSYLGCIDKRNNDEYAAWAFQTIRDQYSSCEFSSDLNEDIMTFKMNLMLAQAQECVLEKSIIDSRKTSINAKISTQIIDYYKIALVNTEKSAFQSNVGSKQSKDLKQYCLFKISYYTALTSYYSALNSAEQKKIGESVGYIQVAEAKIIECQKMKYLKDFQDSLKYVFDMIDAKSKALKKENDFVYNEKVISAENLPEVKGVSLVKSLQIDFENDPEVACQDIFGRLVSMKAHELSSLYSEEKAKIMRQINSQVDDKNSQLEQFLSALQINQLHLNDFDYLKLPKQLLECCASVNVRSGLIKQELPLVMKKIVDVSVQTKSILDDIEDLFEEEDKEFKKFRSTDPANQESDSSLDSSSDSSDTEDYNQKNKPITNQRKQKLKEFLNRYDALCKSHNDANVSNTALREAFNSVINNLQLLTLPLNQLTEKLPKIEPINDKETQLIRDKLLTLLAKVDEMKTQRAQLLNRLQRALQDDDLTKTIASRQNEISNENEFFQEQLKKHEQLMTYLQQNLQAQDNILRALAEANASFATDRKKILDATQERNVFIDNLVFSYQSVNELIDKANKGVSFFEKLNKPLNDLFNDLREFCAKQKVDIENKKKLMQKVNQTFRTHFPNSPQPFNPRLLPSGGSNNQVQNEHVNQENELSAGEINALMASSMNNGANERPKLKDFLPFMKPQSWGPNSKAKPVPPNLNRAVKNNGNFNNFIPVNPQINDQPFTSQVPNAPLPPSYQPPSNQAQQQPNLSFNTNRFNNSQIQLPQAQAQVQQNNFSQQQAFVEQQRMVEEQRLRHQKDYEIQQQKFLEQKVYEQQMKEKEIEFKRQQLEQQQQQFQLIQQQYEMQRQQQQQQFLMQQQKQNQEQALQKIQNTQQVNTQLQNQQLSYQQSLLNQQTQQVQGQFQASLNPIKTPSLPNQTSTQIPYSFNNQQQINPQNPQKPSNPTFSKSTEDNNYPAKQMGSFDPESVYKPGYLNQIKLPNNLVPDFNNPQNTPINNYPNKLNQTPQISTNFANQSSAQTQPVHSANQNISPQVRPVNQANTPLNPAQIKPIAKSSAIDDLFDLFDSSNLSVSSSNSSTSLTVLQPIKIDSSLISAKIKEEVKDSPVITQHNLNSQELSVNTVTPSASSNSIQSVHLASPTDSVSISISSLSSSNKLNRKLDRFVSEVNKFEHHVNSLTNKTLSSATVLEKEWKELNDYQDRQASQMTISIARLNSAKNRFQDLLPFDQTGVCLRSKKGSDDYINASVIGQLAHDLDSIPNVKQPNFIISQLPFTNLTNDLHDFWSMVLQEQIELIVCLCRDNEFGLNNSVPVYYFPSDKQTHLNILNIRICLQSMKETVNSVQRIFTVSNLSENLTRTVVILQYKALSSGIKPSSSGVTGFGQNEMPENIQSFLKFVKECEYFYLKEQRVSSHPILVHCVNGVSRSAVFILTYSMIQLIDSVCDSSVSLSTNSLHVISSDFVLKLIKQMRTKRKYMIQSMYHLKYSYDAILYYLKDILIKEGVLGSDVANFDRKQSIEFDSSIIKDESVFVKDKFSLISSFSEDDLMNPKPAGIKSIAELSDPSKFSLDLKEENLKRKISKKDFISLNNGTSTQIDQNDPFNWLDPLKK